MQKFTLLAASLLFTACATSQPTKSGHPLSNHLSHPHKRHVAKGQTLKVKTTAYTHTEKGGRRNALGKRLSSKVEKSASADWARFPLGTKFEIVQTGDVYRVDDYGSALVGKETIDLYQPTRASMHRWGVRNVDIRILEWGSPEKSLEVLLPRSHNPHVRSMISDLREEI